MKPHIITSLNTTELRTAFFFLSQLKNTLRGYETAKTSSCHYQESHLIHLLASHYYFKSQSGSHRPFTSTVSYPRFKRFFLYYIFFILNLQAVHICGAFTLPTSPLRGPDKNNSTVLDKRIIIKIRVGLVCLRC